MSTIGAAVAAGEAIEVVKRAELLGKVAREWGIFAAMVVFFVIASVYRENTLNQRLDGQDQFIRQTLVTTVDNNTKAFERFEARLAAAEKK